MANVPPLVDATEQTSFSEELCQWLDETQKWVDGAGEQGQQGHAIMIYNRLICFADLEAQTSTINRILASYKGEDEQELVDTLIEDSRYWVTAKSFKTAFRASRICYALVSTQSNRVFENTQTCKDLQTAISACQASDTRGKKQAEKRLAFARVQHSKSQANWHVFAMRFAPVVDRKRQILIFDSRYRPDAYPEEDQLHRITSVDWGNTVVKLLRCMRANPDRLGDVEIWIGGREIKLAGQKEANCQTSAQEWVRQRIQADLGLVALGDIKGDPVNGTQLRM